MEYYNANIRENNPGYLLKQANELVSLAKTHKNSSALIYACLDCRIALEIIELHILLTSVDESERDEIIAATMPRNGIEKVNKKNGSLKHKYQLFLQAVCEVLDIENNYFDFKKSQAIKDQLSTYIHSYYLNDNDLLFHSDIMQNAISLIQNAKDFVYGYLKKDDNNSELSVLNIVHERIPIEDKQILSEWKASPSMDYEELKRKLKENFKKRQSE